MDTTLTVTESVGPELNFMAQTKRLEMIYNGMVRKYPKVMRSAVLWPWVLSLAERRAEENACRGEHLNLDLLDRVLEEKTLRANQR